MDRFFADVAKSLEATDLPKSEQAGLARGMVSEVETCLLSPEGASRYLAELKGRFRITIEAALGRSVGRLTIMPVPNYLVPAIADLRAEFPGLVLADGVKAGSVIENVLCVTPEEALADIRTDDGFLLGTVDQRLGRQFRDRMPPAMTIAAAELIHFDPARRTRMPRPAVKSFADAVRAARRPLVVLSAYVDVTFGPTLEALGQKGYDVFIVTRRPADAGSTSNLTADPQGMADGRQIAVELDEMLGLLRGLDCPVMINYARFFHSLWDMRNTLPLLAYSIAVLRAVTGTSILHLYDAYPVAIFGLEAEVSCFALYRELLNEADAILVNADIVPALRRLLKLEKPMLSFLRYGPDTQVQAEPDPGPFSIVVITNFLSEWFDPTRDTVDAIRALLRQGIHVHYYSSTPIARGFKDGLPDAEAAFFHRHDTVKDQRVLIREISRYHAGWFVIDQRCCGDVAAAFRTGFARELGKEFVDTTAATATLFYGQAGLPTFFCTGYYSARLFPPGTAIEMEQEDAPSVGALVAERDWAAMRRACYEVSANFGIGRHIGQLSAWLDQFYQK